MPQDTMIASYRPPQRRFQPHEQGRTDRQPVLHRQSSRQRGAGTLLICVVAVVAATAFTIVAYTAVLFHSQHRAANAADLAAIDAARAIHNGGDGCAAARHTATSNKTNLTTCDVTALRDEFVVTVEVSIQVHETVPGLPTSLTASAQAGRITTQS